MFNISVKNSNLEWKAVCSVNVDNSVPMKSFENLIEKDPFYFTHLYKRLKTDYLDILK